MSSYPELGSRAEACPRCGARSIKRWSQSSDVWLASCSACAHVWQEPSKRGRIDSVLDRRYRLGVGLFLAAVGAFLVVGMFFYSYGENSPFHSSYSPSELPAGAYRLAATPSVPSFEEARSIPIHFVDDSDPEVIFEVDELQVVGRGEFARLHMTITNHSETDTLGYQPSGVLALLLDSDQASKFTLQVNRGEEMPHVEAISAYENPYSAAQGATLPQSVEPGATWSGWVLLHGIHLPKEAVAMVLILQETTRPRTLGSPAQPYISLVESVAQ